ncbi:hypothetical protein Daesc_002734 [Daldinia eschscholtzii]|uniref:Uncharacterized protein n=1 Tax=Daldinia eschscholtzii TaxID=292717 RepID=A0AAX6MRH6_9PEZI
MYYSSGAFLLKDKKTQHQQLSYNQSQSQSQNKTEVVVQHVRPANNNTPSDVDPILLGSVVPRGAAGGVNVCGERRDSCVAYNQPNICCPVGMVCYASAFSPSGVYCCAPSEPQCLASEAHPPRCDGRMSPCAEDMGGGCCAPNTECASAGCLKVYRAEPGLATKVLSGPPTTITKTTTVLGFGTGAGGVTVTQVKIAETGQSAGVRGG